MRADREDAEVEGVPGDVVLWPTSLLHAVAANCLDVPRFMLTDTARRNDPRASG